MTDTLLYIQTALLESRWAWLAAAFILIGGRIAAYAGHQLIAATSLGDDAKMRLHARSASLRELTQKAAVAIATFGTTAALLAPIGSDAAPGTSAPSPSDIVHSAPAPSTGERTRADNPYGIPD